MLEILKYFIMKVNNYCYFEMFYSCIKDILNWNVFKELDVIRKF